MTKQLIIIPRSFDGNILRLIKKAVSDKDIIEKLFTKNNNQMRILDNARKPKIYS